MEVNQLLKDIGYIIGGIVAIFFVQLKIKKKANTNAKLMSIIYTLLGIGVIVFFLCDIILEIFIW